jgi:hypothetical protein
MFVFRLYLAFGEAVIQAVAEGDRVSGRPNGCIGSRRFCTLPLAGVAIGDSLANLALPVMKPLCHVDGGVCGEACDDGFLALVSGGVLLSDLVRFDRRDRLELGD